MCRQLRESWPVIPFKEENRCLSARDGLVVGDFGRGEAFIAAEAGTLHSIHGFDHVAINKRVIACDVAHVPLKDESLDLAIFCLSLMGANFTDYVREAHNCLRLDGTIHIWEAASYFDDMPTFCAALGRLGFEVTSPNTEGAFVRVLRHQEREETRCKVGASVPRPGDSLPMIGQARWVDVVKHRSNAVRAAGCRRAHDCA